WNKKSKYFDERSTKENPVWMMVDVEFVERFADLVSLDDLKSNAELEGMLVTKRGQRLSIQPVEAEHFRMVKKLGKSKRKG
ncbi:MAG: EVE domain-containing protein, partial [Planctomycetota bacterium]